MARILTRHHCNANLRLQVTQPDNNRIAFPISEIPARQLRGAGMRSCAGSSRVARAGYFGCGNEEGGGAAPPGWARARGESLQLGLPRQPRPGNAPGSGSGGARRLAPPRGAANPAGPRAGPGGRRALIGRRSPRRGPAAGRPAQPAPAAAAPSHAGEDMGSRGAPAPRAGECRAPGSPPPHPSDRTRHPPGPSNGRSPSGSPVTLGAAAQWIGVEWGMRPSCAWPA